MKLHSIKLTLSFVLVLMVSSAFAQPGNLWKKYRHDFSVGYGYNTLLADLGEKDNVGMNFILQRSTFNASYRFFVLNHFAVRASASHAWARKNDKDVNRLERENLRIDYETSLSELALLAEYHIFDESGKANRGVQRRARGGLTNSLKFGVSVFGGVSFSYFRPYGEYFGQRVVLRPVLENPGYNFDEVEYNRWNMHFPLGATIRYVATENWRVGIEGGYRIGFRPYINEGSGVYYPSDTDPNTLPKQEYPNQNFVGYVHFFDTETPLNSPNLQDPKIGFFFGTLTLSYRLKTR